MKKYFFVGMILTLTLAACGQTDALPTQAPPTAAPSLRAPTAPTPTPIVPTTTPIAASYQGLALPTPSLAGSGVVPPPAWLIVGDTAVLATYGSFSISYKIQGTSMQGHADMALPRSRDDFATASLAADTWAVIVIGAGAITTTAIQVSVAREATPLLAGLFDPRVLKVEGHHEGDLTVLTLEPLGNVSDQLLFVSINVEHDSASSFTGSAGYFWRLNPAK